MGLIKQEFIDNETLITGKILNDIQDAIISLEDCTFVLGASGETISTSKSRVGGLQGLKLYGKSYLSGGIVNCGDEGLYVGVHKKNILHIGSFAARNSGSAVTKTNNSIRVVDSTNAYACAQQAVVLSPNTTYTFSADVSITSGACRIGFRVSSNNGKTYNDTATNLSTTITSSGKLSVTFTTSDAVYMLATLFGSWGTAGCDVTFSNIQLEVGSSKTTYEAGAEKQSISNNRVLRGVKVSDSSLATYKDSSGQMWCADEIDYERGVYIQRVKNAVLDDSFGWFASSNSNKYYIALNDAMIVPYTSVSPLCDKYPYCSKPLSSMDDKSFRGGQSTDGTKCLIYINDSSYTSVDSLKQALVTNPITVQYILASPVEYELTGAELEAFSALKTHKPNTTILNDSGAYMTANYAADIQAYIDSKISSSIIEARVE